MDEFLALLDGRDVCAVRFPSSVAFVPTDEVVLTAALVSAALEAQ